MREAKIMLGFDLLILAAVLGVGGSLLLAKSNLEPSFPEQITQTFMNSNPYQMRNLITQRIEAVAGAAWLCGSLPLMALGTILAPDDDQTIRIANQLSHVATLVGVGTVGLWGTLKVTDRISHKKYIPRMIELHREAFAHCVAYLKNRGLLDHELPHQQNFSESNRRDRLAQAAGWLNQIGTLIDVPRAESESDESYLARLRPFFEEKVGTG